MYLLMSTLQITSKVQIDINDLLDGLAQLKTPELEGILAKASDILAQRKAPRLSTQESELLLKINQGLPQEIQRRYDELSEKMSSCTISLTEHEELLELVNQIELKDAERLEHLILLAQLRSISLSDLMEQLELTPPPVHV